MHSHMSQATTQRRQYLQMIHLMVLFEFEDFFSLLRTQRTNIGKRHIALSSTGINYWDSVTCKSAAAMCGMYQITSALKTSCLTDGSHFAPPAPVLPSSYRRLLQ